MKNKITFREAINRLEENNLQHYVLDLHNNLKAILVERGGRLLGPFENDESESIFWINSSFAGKESFKSFLDSTESWNLGGERMWIAPEIQYRSSDRKDFWNTLFLAKEMDPGNYILEKVNENNYKLKAEMSIMAYNLASGQKNLNVERYFSAIPDPLRSLNNYYELTKDVKFAGYEQSINISERKTDDILSEAWVLIQLNAGGNIFIPVTCSDVEFTDYFQPVDENYQKINNNYIDLKISGDRQYKVGYNSAYLSGRLGYMNKIDGQKSYLIIRNFFNNPSSVYAEEPPEVYGKRGNSVHVYNDNGMFGGFGELECNGLTLGGETKRKSSRDAMVLWIYTGKEEKLIEIIRRLLGITL